MKAHSNWRNTVYLGLLLSVLYTANSTATPPAPVAEKSPVAEKAAVVEEGTETETVTEKDAVGERDLRTNDQQNQPTEQVVAEDPSDKQNDSHADADQSAAEKDAAEKDKDKDKDKKDVSVAETFRVASLRVRGSLPESTGQIGLFSDLGISLRDFLKRLEQARDDDEISAVVLEIGNPAIGRGRLNEIRTAIAETRAAGKQVYARLDSAMSVGYLIASACDKIVMPEPGALMVPGVRAEVTFYKQLFDKLHIEADMMQMGDFKGAAEPYTRDRMSEPFRRQFEAVVDDLYAQMTDMIAADRNLPPERVRDLIDQGLFTATDAKQAGLIDVVAYRDQWHDVFDCSDDSLEIIEKYAKKKVDTDFSGMTGFIKILDLFSGGSGRKRSSKRKRIALVTATGVIMPGHSGASLLGGQVMGSDTIVKALREASEDDTVGAIVLRVDSPGGSALASDMIWREIRQLEKPIVASMGDIAASGGYYISMGCDKIFAEPGTMTGSIGVVGGKIATGKLMDRVGVTTEVISRGKNSGILSIQTPFSDTERAAWQKLLADIYRQFTEKAAAGRKMDVEKLRELAGGRIWTGRQAQQNGLVDELGTLADAIAAAEKMAEIDPDKAGSLLILPEPKSFFEQMFESGNIVAPLQNISPTIAKELGDLAVLSRLFREPTLLMLPYQVQIR